jgi:hypothetical protein
MTVGYYRLPNWAHKHQNTAECPIVGKTLLRYQAYGSTYIALRVSLCTAVRTALRTEPLLDDDKQYPP